jgi:hypothetical protein
MKQIIQLLTRITVMMTGIEFFEEQRLKQLDSKRQAREDRSVQPNAKLEKTEVSSQTPS